MQSEGKAFLGQGAMDSVSNRATTPADAPLYEKVCYLERQIQELTQRIIQGHDFIRGNAPTPPGTGEGTKELSRPGITASITRCQVMLGTCHQYMNQIENQL